MLEKIRIPLLEEGLKSPALLSDLAGLETYVAESYSSRSFIELLQNADDAGASRLAICRCGTLLLVANDGHPFTPAEFESLCRSAASSKHRGSSIGYRGIGFKLVVGFAKIVHLLSGNLEATFSRELTSKAIPQASRVPLIRIPHSLDPTAQSHFADTSKKLTQEGYKTIFIFDELIANSIESEFASFDPTSLLFLRNIQQVELKTNIETIITIRRETISDTEYLLRLASAEGVSKWTMLTHEDIALAFINDNAGISRLDERQSVVHAFLPTHESSGFSFKINGDISTDPSRTRIVMDDRTVVAIEKAAKLILALLLDCLNDKHDSPLLAALVPASDPRMITFQKRSFRTDLYAAVKKIAQEHFNNFLLRPSWLNALDFEKLTQAAGIKALQRKYDSIEGLPAFLKFLGAKEATLKDITPELSNTTPSLTGAAEIVANLTTLHSTKQISPKEIKTSWRLWHTGEKTLSLEDAACKKSPLSQDFIDLVAEKSGSPNELVRLLSATVGAQEAATMVPSAEIVGQQEKKEISLPTITAASISLKKWRSAEQQVLSILNAKGWRAEDVSRQNLGYDIECKTPEGADVFIEVKSIDYPGQPFILTSNEEAVARQLGKAYRLALVRQTETHLELAYIADPANSVKLIRQCRQWVWECGAYNFSPEQFLLE